jgi:hypothetical protein
MALARRESTSSASVAEQQTDPAEPCQPSQGCDRVQKRQAEDGEGCEPGESRGGLWDDFQAVEANCLAILGNVVHPAWLAGRDVEPGHASIRAYFGDPRATEDSLALRLLSLPGDRALRRRCGNIDATRASRVHGSKAMALHPGRNLRRPRSRVRPPRDRGMRPSGRIPSRSG